ncbi:MAG: 2-dehydropantoate 2-reductase [Clostridia bacterium]|nr:2-dehydropantoate 2-reductase [Clostridia bacterium]
MKIALIGPGGVGGLLAGAMLRRDAHAVSIVAREPRASHLRQHGLTLHSELYGNFTVRPGCVTNDPSALSVQDAILICVKNDALPAVARQIEPIVGPNTLVMPVMNGVSAGDTLRGLLPRGHVLDCVIYTVSSSDESYAITQKGPFTYLFAGAAPGDAKGAEGCQRLCDALQALDVDCRYAQDVRAAIWGKYVLNCAYNVVTARWGVTIGEIKHSDKLRSEYRTLMEEAAQVGRAMGVNIPGDLVDINMDKLMTCTDDSTSSLSRDFAEGQVGEMTLFSHEVIKMAEQTGIDVPMTRDYARGMEERAAAFTKS